MSMNETSFRNDTTTSITRNCFRGACRFNRSRIPEATEQTSNQCGYCDTDCIYHAIECIFTVGIIANAIVLVLVARDRKLRTPTFVSIAACAVADLYFLIIYLVMSYWELISTITCNYPSRSRQRIYKAMTVVAWFTANGHMTMLAVVRYIILIHPIKSKICLRTRRVLLLSVLVWVLALLISISPSILGLIIDIRRRKSLEFQIAIWTTVYLTPITTFVVLHLVKLYKVGQTTTVTTNEQAKQRVQAMSRMVLLVIVIATALPLPHVLHRFLQLYGDDSYGSPAISLHVGYIAHLLVLLNHSINPVMYAFVSEPFRMSLRKMLRLDHKASNASNGHKSSNETPLARVSDIQRQEENLKRTTEIGQNDENGDEYTSTGTVVTVD